MWPWNQMVVTVPHAVCKQEGFCDRTAQHCAQLFVSSLSPSLVSYKDALQLWLGDQPRDRDVNDSVPTCSTICWISQLQQQVKKQEKQPQEKQQQQKPCPVASAPEKCCDLNRVRCRGRPFRQRLRTRLASINKPDTEKQRNKKVWLWDVHSFPTQTRSFRRPPPHHETVPEFVVLDNHHNGAGQALVRWLRRQSIEAFWFPGGENDIIQESLHLFPTLVTSALLLEFNDGLTDERRHFLIQLLTRWALFFSLSPFISSSSSSSSSRSIQSAGYRPPHDRRHGGNKSRVQDEAVEYERLMQNASLRSIQSAGYPHDRRHGGKSRVQDEAAEYERLMQNASLRSIQSAGYPHDRRHGGNKSTVQDEAAEYERLMQNASSRSIQSAGYRPPHDRRHGGNKSRVQDEAAEYERLMQNAIGKIVVQPHNVHRIGIAGGLPIYTWQYRVDSGAWITVVRDDLIPGGTKMRFLPRLLDNIKKPEAVYSAAAQGGGAIMLAVASRRTRSRPKITVFMQPAPNSRDGLTASTRVAHDLGTQIQFSYDPHDTSRWYAMKQPSIRHWFEPGFPQADNDQSISQVVRLLVDHYGVPFDECWCVAGSGHLTMALQSTDLASQYYAVDLFSSLAQPPRSLGRAVVLPTPWPVEQPTPIDQRPPFPSTIYYDAKAWAYLRRRPPHRRILFWNVL